MELDIECRGIIDNSEFFYDLLPSLVEHLINKGIDENDLWDLYVNNSDVLFKFESRISSQIKNYDLCINDFDELKRRVLGIIGKTDLTVNYDKVENVSCLLVLYCILRAADTAIGDWDINLLKKCGPLDKKTNNKYRLYILPRETLNKQYRDHINRTRAGRYSLFQDFENMCFFESEDWVKKNSIPNGIIVSTNLFKNRTSIIIGVSHFINNDSNVVIKSRKESNNKKYILYKEEQNRFASYVERTIKKAIDNSCDILIFPEYSCSEKIREKISDYLSVCKRKNKKTPIITIAGSTWTNDNSNVSYAYNNRGKEIGRYYKKFRYRDKNRKDMEDLDVNNLGKECPFYFIKGLGMILPAICRDAVEKGYTDCLTSLFFPEFLLVPAFSKSINDFKRHLTPFAELQYTSSVVVGYCDIIKKDKVGMCFMPCKDDTMASHKEGSLYRKTCSSPDDCKNGCLQVIEMDFTFKVDDNEEVVTNTSLRINGEEI